MNIDISTKDLYQLRKLLHEQHRAIGQYPIMQQSKDQRPGWDGTILALKRDQALLRLVYRELTKALKRHAGHDFMANEEMLEQ